MDTPHNLLLSLISMQKSKEEKQDIWKDSPYKDLVKLQSNNTGIVGEKFIQELCDRVGISANVDGTKTKKIGGGVGDGCVNNKIVEIKTAHLGCNESSFQHELGEKPWISEYMIFVDISPSCIYITVFRNFSEEFYNSGEKCVPYFPTRKITHRKKCGAYKLDTNIPMNEKNITEGYTIKITEDANLQQIKDFIDLNIK